MSPESVARRNRLFSRQRLTRRQAIARSGTGLAIAGLAATHPASSLGYRAIAQEATPLATPATPATAAVTLTGIAFADPEFDGQFLRALDTIFVGGADIGECFITARSIAPGDYDGWRAAWQATGDRVYAAAEVSLAERHLVSAREGFLRAVTYYRTSSVFMYKPPLDPLFVDAYRRQRDAFQRAAKLSEWTIEVAQIPYEDTTLEAYFATPSGEGPFRTLVMVGGYDGTKEELYLAGGVAALRRGYAVLMIDGPGQGGALIEQGLFFRPDWETVVTPQIDWLLTRPEVDPERIALMGRSWGGYLAPRAATAEHRIAALVADAAQYAAGARAKSSLPEEYQDQLMTGDPDVLNAVLEQGIAMYPSLSFVFDRGMLTHGVATPLEYLQTSMSYTLEGIAGQIQCPTLVCEGENDSRGGDAKPLYDAVNVPKEYILFANADGAGEHDEAGAASLFSQRVFGWLDETLG